MTAEPIGDEHQDQAPELADLEARLEHTRILFAELATFADLPLPSSHPGDWDEYQRTTRLRLDQIAQLCRAAGQSDTLPLSVEACIAVVKACNAAGIWYQPEPAVYGARQTSAEIDAAELRAAGRPVRIVAVLGADGRDSGRTVLEPVERCTRAVHDSVAGWWCPCHGDGDPAGGRP